MRFLQRVAWLLWHFKAEARLVWAMLRNRSTPLASKILIFLAFAYLISPIDFLPDIIPLLGWMDDGVIMTLLIAVAFKLMPVKLYQQLRATTAEQTYPWRKSA